MLIHRAFIVISSKISRDFTNPHIAHSKLLRTSFKIGFSNRIQTGPQFFGSFQLTSDVPFCM